MADAPPKTRILILGGGFGGLYAALHLDKTVAKDADVEVTLISETNFILFTPMLHEVAASDLDMSNIVNPIRKMLKHVLFFEAIVEKIDLQAKAVTVGYSLPGSIGIFIMTSCSSPSGQRRASSTARGCAKTPSR